MKLPPIHPFPARMAPEIAISTLKQLPNGSVVVDPMMGSGTVIRHAVEAGHRAIGFDLDPLAVLMSRVWSTPVRDRAIELGTQKLKKILSDLGPDEIYLPWIDDDKETRQFVSFWFGKKQKSALRRLAFALTEFESTGGREQRAVVDVFRVAMSRIIITKSSGASLAHDVSHSRPHRVMTSSKFDVVWAFERSLKLVRDRLASTPIHAQAEFNLGDARKLCGIRKGSADLILTSPPYLNAIDYMRGHKLSLVWLGHSISTLRYIRSCSVGAERKASEEIADSARVIQKAMVNSSRLDPRRLAMVERYSLDLSKMMLEIARILKPKGKAILVVGNSCLRETFIRNSAGVSAAGAAAGLKLVSENVRDLPAQSRYLPMPKSSDSALGKRMRTESILTFEHVA